jgi:thioredoxin 1
MTTVQRLTEATFDELIAGSPVPVLVDVTAEWCPPCKAMEPVLADLALERTGHLVVASIDADDHPEVSRRLGVLGLPTMVLFVDGVEQLRLVGARGRAHLDEDLHPFVAETEARSS